MVMRFTAVLSRCLGQTGGESRWLPGNPELMKAFDGLNQRYGTGTVFLAAEGIAPKWGMWREYLSPQYTARWGDVPRVRC